MGAKQPDYCVDGHAVFYRLDDQGNAVVLFVEDGDWVTMIPGASTIYPVGSMFSAEYEHPEGIVLSVADAEALGIRGEWLKG